MQQDGVFSRPRSLTSVSEARPTCYGCLRPLRHCLCRLVRPFEAHVNFLILQHPNERKKYCSTTKIVMKAVRNARMMRGVVFNPETILRAVQGQEVFLLYPGKDSVDCASVELDRSKTVIVVDGTWDEAQKIIYRNPFLRRFPKLSFSSAPLSNYHIRRQPKAHCLSTLESISYLLKRSGRGREGGCDSSDSLLEAFEKMVEQQLAFRPGEGTEG